MEDSFQLHGYVENQEIIRSENYVSDYNVASIRNRIDLQPSGQIINNATLPTVMGVPLGKWSLGRATSPKSGPATKAYTIAYRPFRQSHYRVFGYRHFGI